MSKNKSKTNILIVEDDQPQRLFIRMSLDEENYNISEAENGIQALEIIKENPDLRFVITDLKMPQMDGFELIGAIRKNEPRYTYIIVLTSSDDEKSTLRALELGADDYLIKPVRPEELKLRLQGGDRLLLLEGHEELIFSMAKLADYRSQETGFHLERIKYYTKLLAQKMVKYHPEMGITPSIAEEIVQVSPLHDLGKVAISDNILHKPGPLTKEEFEIIKSHTTIGGNLLEDIYQKTHSPYLKYAYKIAMYHHERWDGQGYPGNLKENEIPLSARIVALADVYDAMTSHRCYKEAFPHDKAKDYIVSQREKHFDPIIVDIFLKFEEEWLAIKNRFPDNP